MATIALNIDVFKIKNDRNWIGNQPFYHLIWNHFNPENIFKPGFVVHHKDGNPLNDHISNLELMTRSNHMRLHQLGKFVSDETKSRLSIASQGNTNWLGKHHSEESKRKMSEWQKGKKLTIEHREKLSNAHKGKVISDEHRKKISNTLKGKKRPPFSDEWKRNMSLAKSGNKDVNN